MFEQVAEALAEADKRYTITNMKIDAYCESVLAQYQINCKKAELKVLKESGTTEDYFYLEDAAGSGMIESFKNAIKKIIDTFRKFVNEVKLKILSKITSATTKEKINKIDKKIRFNPFLSKKKIQVKDDKRIDKIIKEANADTKKLLARIKSGKEVKAEDINEVEDKFKKKIATAAGIAAAVSVSIAAALLIVKKKGGSINKEMEDDKKEAEANISETEDACGPMSNQVPALQKIAALFSTISKESINQKVATIMETLSAIGKAIMKKDNSKYVNSTPGQVKQDLSDEEEQYDSAHDFIDGDGFMESETDQMLKEIEADLFSENSDDDDLDSYMEGFDDFDFEF